MIREWTRGQPWPCPLAVSSGVVARRHRRCRIPMCRRCLRCTLSRRLTTPHAVVHRHCTVVPLSRCWIRRHHLPPSSSLRRLHRRAVGCHRCGAIGCRRRTVFALPGPPPSPLCIGVPCTRLVVPFCHPAASVCVVAPLCTAVVVVRGVRCRRKNWLVHELTKLRSYDDTTNEL